MYDVSLEFGGSYQRKFIAPRTGEKATVAFELALAPETLEGLCFGAYSGGNYIDGIVWSPEPRKQDDRLRNFPKLGRGVVDTALGLRVRLTREVEQPDGEILEWQWHRQKDYFGDDLLLTDDSIVVQAAEFYREGDGYNVTRDLRKDDYFTNVKEEHGVQYLAFSGNHRSTTPLEFPSGKLRCDVRAIYGSATEDVISALGMKPKAGREVWLNASISPESAWVPLAIDLADLTRGDSKEDLNALAFKTLSLEAGSKYVFELSSPKTPVEQSEQSGASMKKSNGSTTSLEVEPAALAERLQGSWLVDTALSNGVTVPTATRIDGLVFRGSRFFWTAAGHEHPCSKSS